MHNYDKISKICKIREFSKYILTHSVTAYLLYLVVKETFKLNQAIKKLIIIKKTSLQCQLNDSQSNILSPRDEKRILPLCGV